MSHNEAKTLQKKPFFGVAVAKDSPVDGPVALLLKPPQPCTLPPFARNTACMDGWEARNRTWEPGVALFSPDALLVAVSTFGHQ